MKVIVGLGNPGDKYVATRHNIGFLFVDYLAQKLGFEFKQQSKLKSLVAEGLFEGQKLLLVKPITFMNLSGEATLAIQNYYKLSNQDFVMVYDDIDLGFGNLRYRLSGSAGTHNGMRSIIHLHKSEDVPRLRLGVEGRSEELKAKWALRDYVLADFTAEESAKLTELFAKAWQDLQLKLKCLND